MPLYTADALVLRTYALGEADRIVVFLTEDRGKKRGVAKGARRPRSRFAGALEPLTQVRVAYFEKERRELVGLNYAETARSPLAARPEAMAHIGYFAELLDEWAQDGDPSERLYRLGASVLDALGTGCAVEPLARYLEFWILRLQGVYPPFRACHRCGASFRDGGGAWLAPGEQVLTCAACAPAPVAQLGPNLSLGALGVLHEMRRLSPRAAGELAIDPTAAAELERVHHVLMGRHLERELKSTRVLRELRRPAGERSPRQAESNR
jgi:DNA repair protein RecO (recombination protein O)